MVKYSLDDRYGDQAGLVKGAATATTSDIDPFSDDLTSQRIDIEAESSTFRPEHTPEVYNEPTTNEGNAPLLRTTSSSHQSLARKLTTYLSRSNTLFSSTSARSRFGSRRGYANINDGDEAGLVGVDLSSLTGMGFEMREIHEDQDEPGALEDQDTAYQGASSSLPSAANDGAQSAAVNKPDFRTWRARRRNIGDGLSNTIQLTRNATLRQDREPRTEPMNQPSAIQRSVTVRSIGQSLAEKQNKIVAIREDAVDLSVLEGAQMARRVNSSFADMEFVRSGTAGLNPDSYYFPRQDNEPNWKPFSVSGPYIVLLTLIALTLAGVQEYLYQRSRLAEKQQEGLLTFSQVADISVAAFFAWKYMPTMVTIVYAVLFSIMDFDIRRLEPYYQLSQPLGSSAAASLNLDHLTTFQYFVPFNAMKLGQWAVAFSTIGNIVASTVCPALQNPSVNFQTNSCGPERNGSHCPHGEKYYSVVIDPVWSRLLSACYLLIAIITVILFFQLRRKSGLLSDPKGIAGVASMAVKSHILHDFKGLDLATRGEIHRRLAHRRFVLYQSSIWQGEWSTKSEPFQESEKRLKSPHPPMLRLTAGIPFVSVMVFCLIMVPIISLTNANVIPNKVPWLPILIATLLKLVWNTFEADVRLMEPFYILSKGNAQPENSLTLDYQASVYGIMPFIAAYNRHWLVAVVGLCSVMLDILSVTVGSFSVNASIFIAKGSEPIKSDESETNVSFYTSVALSMSILLIVIVVTTIVYMKRRHPFLPREPSTIAAVLAFIYSSKMLDDFIGTERMTSKEIQRKLKATGKTYGLGWFTGRDGQVHCAIDAEPMRSKYELNRRYIDATIVGPWNQDPDTFHHV